MQYFIGYTFSINPGSCSPCRIGKMCTGFIILCNVFHKKNKKSILYKPVFVSVSKLGLQDNIDIFTQIRSGFHQGKILIAAGYPSN